MSSIAFIAVFGVFLIGACAFLPFGILAWLWFTVQNPHQLVGVDLPMNLAIVLACIIGLFTHRKKATLWVDGTVIMLVVLLAHSAMTTFVGFTPDYSYPYFDRMWKTMALAGFIVLFMQNRTRLQAIVWVAVASIAMIAAKGAAFSILTAGQHRIFGPEGTQIGDNNHLAGVICMVLPLCLYLAATAQNATTKLAVRLLACFLPAAVLFTYSRGGLVTLSAVSFCYFLQARRKLPIAAALIAAVLFLLPMMPAHWLERMQTISETVNDTSKADGSIQGRFNAWYVYSQIAIERPFVGAGFRSPEVTTVWSRYLAQDIPKAAHNNVFQVLGEHGFLGLAIYLTIILLAFKNVASIMVRTRHIPELAWARQLATACGISLVAYNVAGLTISIPYYDLFFVLAVVVASLRRLVVQTIAARDTARGALGQVRVAPYGQGTRGPQPQPSLRGGAAQ